MTSAYNLGGQTKASKNREEEARKYKARGIAVKFDDLEYVEKPFSAPVYRYGGELLTAAGVRDADPIKAVVLSDDGTDTVLKLRRLRGIELEQIDSNADRDAKQAARSARAAKEWARILKSAKYVPLTMAATPGEAGPATLTELQRLTAETGANLKVVRGGDAVVVLAPDPVTVFTEAGAVVGDAPLEAQMVSKARKHYAACHALLRCVIDLDSLAVAYASAGKAPKSDHGRGNADRNVGGAWLS